MLELFKAEFLRHWKWTTALGVIHFLLLYHTNMIGAAFVTNPMVRLWLLIVVIFPAAFGALQMRLYVRGNEWTYLLHRPISHHRIFLALAAAAFCQFLVCRSKQ